MNLNEHIITRLAGAIITLSSRLHRWEIENDRMAKLDSNYLWQATHDLLDAIEDAAAWAEPADQYDFATTLAAAADRIRLPLQQSYTASPVFVATDTYANSAGSMVGITLAYAAVDQIRLGASPALRTALDRALILADAQEHLDLIAEEARQVDNYYVQCL